MQWILHLYFYSTLLFYHLFWYALIYIFICCIRVSLHLFVGREATHHFIHV